MTAQSQMLTFQEVLDASKELTLGVLRECVFPDIRVSFTPSLKPDDAFEIRVGKSELVASATTHLSLLYLLSKIQNASTIGSWEKCLGNYSPKITFRAFFDSEDESDLKLALKCVSLSCNAVLTKRPDLELSDLGLTAYYCYEPKGSLQQSLEDRLYLIDPFLKQALVADLKQALKEVKSAIYFKSSKLSEKILKSPKFRQFSTQEIVLSEVKILEEAFEKRPLFYFFSSEQNTLIDENEVLKTLYFKIKRSTKLLVEEECSFLSDFEPSSSGNFNPFVVHLKSHLPENVIGALIQNSSIETEALFATMWKKRFLS